MIYLSTNKKNPKKFLLLMLLLCSISAGSVYAQTMGDVDSSGTINIIDALKIAQYYVGLSVPNFNVANADVSCNGRVEIIDALVIAQYYVGLIDTFPCGTPGTPQPGGKEPKAAFTISNITPSLNQTVTFNGSGSTDPDGTIVRYDWDFRDGSTATGVQVTHSFSEVDDYNVTLTVTDNSGLSDDKKERVFIGRPQGWTEDTHHKSADADYDLLFSLTDVPRLDITISSQDFQNMERDRESLNIMFPQDPMYVKATVEFNGSTWWNVGIRYKGQSTLFTPGMDGKSKFPFRMNFDKFEDDYPEINNQRFYGFDKMTFANCWFDATYMKDVILGEIFRNGGVPAARGGFARIYVNSGSGPVYWGLYSMIEDPSDQMTRYQFDDDEGNMYKPTGNGAEFSTFIQSSLEKKTNEDAADYSDMQAFISALNAPRSNAAGWRANLEATFNVRSFLRWIAINTAVVNWDTYGWVTKNFYIYQDLADNGRLVWIPWDFNLSLTLDNPFSGQFPINIPIPSLSLDNMESRWPLIRYLIDDPVYNDIYHQEMRTAMNGCLNEADIISRINEFTSLIRPYVSAETNTYSYLSNGVSQFDQAVSTLQNHIRSRLNTVRNYLNSL